MKENNRYEMSGNLYALVLYSTIINFYSSESFTGAHRAGNLINPNYEQDYKRVIKRKKTQLLIWLLFCLINVKIFRRNEQTFQNIKRKLKEIKS